VALTDGNESRSQGMDCIVVLKSEQNGASRLKIGERRGEMFSSVEGNSVLKSEQARRDGEY